MSVNSQSLTVIAAEEARALPRALMGGTPSMQAAKEKYLPREAAETNAAYKSRLERSFLFNGYGKAVKDFVGKVFSKDIILEKDMPPEIIDYCQNIDLAGQNLDVFARSAFTDAFTDGISYILADMDPAPDGVVTVQDAKALNRRPWLVHIKAHQALGWASKPIYGKQTLTQFRFSDDQVVIGADFSEKMIKQVRVYNREDSGSISWQVWQRKGEVTTVSDGWQITEEGQVKGVTEIPVVPVYVNRTGFMIGLPPLQDLAEVNKAHWQSQSDQRTILHVARVPVLFGVAINTNGVTEIGAGRMITAENPAAKLSYVEHSGAAIGSGQADLDKLEMQMQILGLELIIPSRASQSATGAVIDQTKMTAPLAMMAKALEDAIENALNLMAQFAGLPDGGSVEVNKDFSIGFNAAQDAVTILAASAQGVISKTTAIRELIRRGLLSDTLSPEDEVLAAMNDTYMNDPTYI